MKNDEPLWRRYLRFLDSDVDADIDDELRFHLEMKEREFATKGMGPNEARQAAAEAFGEYEEVRRWLRDHDRRSRSRSRRADHLDGVLLDLRFGVRKLRKQPGFTAIVVVILALGIGTTTAVFSAVDALVLRPLPFADAANLVEIDGLTIPMVFPGGPTRTGGPAAGAPDAPTGGRQAPDAKSSPDLTDLATVDDVFVAHAAYAWGSLNLTGAGEPIRVRIAMVTPSFFSTLGAFPRSGRPLGVGNGRAESREVILSDALARRQFVRGEIAIGRTIQLHGMDHQVVGVMPPGFGYPYESDVWITMPIPITAADREPFRQFMPSVVIARLQPGVSLERADSRVRSLYASYGGRSEQRAEETVAFVLPLHDQLMGDRPAAVLILFGATLLVLLVACANIANLLLAKGESRRPEMAMRAALGAGRWRIGQQLGIESLILCVGGGAAGLAMAHLSMQPLGTLVPPHLAGTISLHIDPRVLAFSLMLVLLTTVVFGLWPILGTGRETPRVAIAGGSRTQTEGRGGARSRGAFVVAEIALALMLLIGAIVMVRSFTTLLAVDPGVDTERIATLELTLANAVHETAAERRRFVEGVLGRLNEDPRIEAAAFVNELPLRGDGGISISIMPEGMPPEQTAEIPFTMSLNITPEHFRTMGIPLLRGRTFRGTGDADERGEIIVNQLLAERFWPGEDPIGKSLSLGGLRMVEVVGVVGNVKGRSLDTPLVPQMYQSMVGSPYPHLALVARSNIQPAELAVALREAVRQVEPTQAVYNVKTMREVIAGPLAQRRTNTVLMSIFGALATVLAVIGVYGVLSYDVTQRSRELGIRMALGAASSRILRYVLRRGLRLALVGIAVGLAGAWIAVRSLESLVYEVGPRDPLAFTAAPILMLGVALIAILIPALRAARIDPAAMFRVE
jgi:putative ABC transport system permease protein